MKLGSLQHKELFCRSFIDTHLVYEPEKIPFPHLEGAELEKLRAIPFWKEALYTERKAGKMVSAFAETINDPLIKEAIALQGREESRHARLIQVLVDRYEIEITDLPEINLPNKIETAFSDFGFEECLDSFFAFGLFDIARRAKYLPEAMFNIFDPLLDEEARHIVFFVNWFTYEQIQQGKGLESLRAISTLGHYKNALWGLIKTFSGSQKDKQKNFTATGARTFMDDLTASFFFTTCLEANGRRMKVFEDELLRPQLIPSLSKFALSLLRFLPQQ
jgi:hypothetical protein